MLIIKKSLKNKSQIQVPKNLKIKKEAALSAAWLDTVHVGEAQDMSFIPDGKISLVVTSPPYLTAIDYDSHVKDKNADYRDTTEAKMDVDWYFKDMHNAFREIWRVTAAGGFLCIVIGTCITEVNGERQHVPLPHRMSTLLENYGWEFWENITWNKVTGGAKRFGVFIQHPYPGYYFPNMMTENIMIFRRPRELKPSGWECAPPIYKERGTKELEENKVKIDDVMKKDTANNIWHIAPVDPGTAKKIGHPCPFPEEIPYRLISLYSYKGAAVLDPYAGSGTALKVAKCLGRHFVGVDKEKAYVALSKKRVNEPLHLRPEQLTPRYDKTKIAF